MVRSRWLGCVLVLTACAAKPPPAAERPSAPKRPAGGSLEQPVMRCGPRDSYAFVAREFRCPDGTNPFDGDDRAAAHSRSGAQRHPKSGHLVDTYEVPCSGGTVTVFIDMYGCEKYERLLTERSAELGEVEARFETGRYAEVVQRCEQIHGAGKPIDAFSWCGALEPAALVLLGDGRATAILKRHCEPMPPDSAKSDARVQAVLLSMVAIARGSHQTGPRIDAETASDILAAFSQACAVDPRRVVEQLEAESA